MISRRNVLKFGLLAAAPVVLPGGCYRTTIKSGWQPLAGKEYMTRRGLSFWWIHGTILYPTPEIAAEEIDRIYVEWNAWYTVTYNDQQPWQLLSRTLAVDIQTMPWPRIPGNDDNAFTLGIYWETHKQIDVAMRAAYHWDPTIGQYTRGLEVLKHEWTHVIRGNFHG